jgi:FkbM family methyltransferase
MIGTNLLKPHYVFHPTQVARRVRFAIERPSRERNSRLPWGSVIAYDPRETVGMMIGRCGVFDIVVCETLTRLTDDGETSIDVGANIGQMSSALASAAGPTGLVIAFEPHPAVFDQLTRNVRKWADVPTMARIDLRRVAVSDQEGTATLSTRFFNSNHGSASLEPTTYAESTTVDAHTVPVQPLDTAIGPGVSIGVMKIDIEGHELPALSGATDMLSAGCIRDIVFEERNEPPTVVTRLLEEHGYTILRLAEGLLGPEVDTIDQRASYRTWRGDDRSLLATRAPRRATERLGLRGWAIYGAGPARRFDRRTHAYRKSRSHHT